MRKVQRNAITPLHMLLEASFFPKQAILRVDPRNKFLEAETQDAIEHRALLWNELLYAWAVEEGQLDLRQVITPTGPVSIDVTRFYPALGNVQKIVDLEFSIPMGSETSGPRLKPLPTQRLRLNERTAWTLIDFSSKPIPVRLQRQLDRMLADGADANLRAFGVPMAQPAGVGEVWVRITERAKRALTNDAYNTLRTMVLLGGARREALQTVYEAQQPNLTEKQLEVFNNHLALGWGSVLEGALQYAQQHLRGLSPAKKNRVVSGFMERIGQRYVDRQAADPASPAKMVFVSYSHEDEMWLKKLETMLAPLVRSRAVPLWTDKKITPGAKWRREVDAAMKAARIAVLIVSKHYLASDFINDVELPYILESAKTHRVQIFSMFVGHCMYKNTPLREIQAANNPGKPLSAFRGSQQDRELLAVCEKLQDMCAAIGSPT